MEGVKIVFFGKSLRSETICNKDTSVPEKNVFFCNDCYGIGLILQAFAISKNRSSQRLRNSVENKKRTNTTMPTSSLLFQTPPFFIAPKTKNSHQ